MAKSILDIDAIRSIIETEGQQADHRPLEAKRIEDEKIFVDEELDRLIKTEKLYEQRHKNHNLKQNIAARKSYAHKTFVLTCIWALLIFIVVFSIATKKLIFYPSWSFELSDKVIITLITSTTVNFFGFFILVMRYLFYTGEGKKEKKKPKKEKKEPNEDEKKQ